MCCLFCMYNVVPVYIACVNNAAVPSKVPHAVFCGSVVLILCVLVLKNI